MASNIRCSASRRYRWTSGVRSSRSPWAAADAGLYPGAGGASLASPQTRYSSTNRFCL